jgi:multiple sugar transport system substrate-binding protein
MGLLPRADAAVAAAWLLLLGCAGPGGEPVAIPRVGLLVPPSERPAWDRVARDFMRVHPGIRIDVVEGPQATDLRENLYTASLLAQDPSFDLVYMDVTWTSKFAGAGWLLPLDAELGPDEQRRLFPAAVEAGRFEGVLYRVPVRTDVGLLYWRRDLLHASGIDPPRTFPELVRAARALQSPPGTWGFVWQGKQYEGLVCVFLEVLYGHGGTWVDPETREVGLDRPEAVAALTFLRDCVDTHGITPRGVTTYQEEESRRLFQDGRAVFLRNWPYVWRLAGSEDSPVRGRVAAGPMPASPGGRSAGTLGGWGFGISRYSRHPREALAFIRHAVSLDGQKLLCLDTGYAPARVDAYADTSFLSRNPFLATIEHVHQSAVPRPAIPRYALASDILQRHLTAALSGSVEPRDALRGAARETRALLGR